MLGCFRGMQQARQWATWSSMQTSQHGVWFQYAPQIEAARLHKYRSHVDHTRMEICIRQSPADLLSQSAKSSSLPEETLQTRNSLMRTFRGSLPAFYALHTSARYAHPLHDSSLHLLYFMICHSNKCHRPRTSSCHKEQRGGTEYG